MAQIRPRLFGANPRADIAFQIIQLSRAKVYRGDPVTDERDTGFNASRCKLLTGTLSEISFLRLSWGGANRRGQTALSELSKMIRHQRSHTCDNVRLVNQEPSSECHSTVFKPTLKQNGPHRN
jgi:hypothetical protein